jgi:hypothetical protein
MFISDFSQPIDILILFLKLQMKILTVVTRTFCEDATMTLKDEINRIRNLSNQSQQLIQLKKKVAEDFDRGILTHERLDLYMQERDQILQGVKREIKT